MTVRSWIHNLFTSRTRRKAPGHRPTVEALEERSVLSITFAPTLYQAAGAAPSSFAVADFNRDGNPDLAVATHTGNTVSVLLGQGDGSFDGPVAYGAGLVANAVAACDFNGDGNPDLAVANRGSGNVSVLLGKGDGTFQSAVNFAAGDSPISLAVGDFNGDGRQDLATANAVGTVSVLLGNGGTFQTAVNYAAGDQPLSVSVGDFNGDGKLDLATANFYPDNVNVLLGNGDGSFQDAFVVGNGNMSFGLAVGDFDSDGKQDLVASILDSNDIMVLLNRFAPGRLAFSAPTFKVAENKGSATITVTRTDGHDGPLTVQVSTTSGTATMGSDFSDATQTLTFADGEISKTFTIPIFLDALVEKNEALTLTLSNPTGASLGAQSTAELVIQVPAITVELVKRQVGTKQKLFVQVFYADSGELKTEFRSPFQRPAYRQVVARAVDSNKDGLRDAVRLTARKVSTNSLVRRLRLV
jgi:Calx-beta domain/FG-GAP-like repeat/FG-GAP repeat